MCQPIVPAISAMCPEPDCSEGQGYIIENYQEPFQGDFLLLKPVMNRPAAEIDKGAWLDQEKYTAFMLET